MRKLRSAAAAMAAVMCITGHVCWMNAGQTSLAETMQAAGEEKEQPYQYTVYVSLNGSEDGTGTEEQPFSSIEQARNYMRTKELDETNRGMIYIREGTYQVKKDNPTVELTAEDSYVTYAAYPGEKVTLSGTAKLSNGRFRKLSEVDGEQYICQNRLPENMRDRVYVYDLGAEGIPVGSILKNGFNWPKQTFAPELMVDGELQTLAQYPNGNTKLNQKQILAGKAKKPSDENADTEAAKAAGANEGERPRNYWFDKTDTPKTYEEMLILKGPVFYTQNGLEERIAAWAPPTVPGEPQENQPQVHVNTDCTKYETDGWLSGYFENNYANDMCRIYSVDTKMHTVHCKYPSLQGVQDKRIQLAAVNLLCELDEEGEYYIDRYNQHDVLYFYPEGGSLDSREIALTSSDAPFFAIEGATGITISGMTMTGTTGNGIEMRNCESCTIEACEFSNISMDAVKIGENNQSVTADPSYETRAGGHNNVVRNCRIHDMGCGGVYLSGGNEQTLERGNNVVEHCEIYNISRLQTYTPAVYLEGVGNTARYNEIHDAPHMVIQIMGNDMLVSHNRIRNVCTNTADQAPIYSGRCLNWLGNEISYNLIENIGSGCYAVYMDDFMSGMHIHHNIFKDIKGTAVFSNNGFGHRITDNVFIRVGETVKYARHNSASRPIPNEKVLVYRYYRVLRQGDGSNYTNTEANIRNWQEHYAGQYPFLNEKYLPAETDTAWNTDVNSVFVPAQQTLQRSIIAGTAKSNTSAVKSLQDQAFDTENYTAVSVDKLGLDLTNGKFHADSPLAQETDYGPQWIEGWNTIFSLEEIGPKKDSQPADPPAATGALSTKIPAAASPSPTGGQSAGRPTVQPSSQAQGTTPPTGGGPAASQPAGNVRKGDVNLDGTVDLSDAQLVLKRALKIVTLTSQQQLIADVDGSGTVDLTDAQLVLKAALKIIQL